MKQPNSLFLDLNDTTRYQAWRDQKLSQMPASIDQYLVPVKDPVRLSADEYNAIHDLLQRSNMAIFVADPDEARNKTIPVNISSQFGMHRLDHNMGADHDGVSELTVRSGQWRGGYIPYTNKPIHWHTDGYYNEERRKINGMVLYCVQNALRGGENALLDHEIAYIHLRDSNPEYIRAFLHPQAMTIPANIINNNEIRPERTGPVFSVNDSGALHMRYTARTRSISWRDDELTREATDCLSEFLASDSPYILRAGLNPGMGLICNNILHDRSGFDEDDNHRRLIYRLRYYDRADS
ncbi:MAG: TauD/TfdA family dioxygenase [Arenicellales bacterium]|jgi:alpha-ketoglutarate-dependent taurine dioxygenase